MKWISSTAVMVMLYCLAGSLSAQQPDILGKKTPPLQSLSGFDQQESRIEPGATAITTRESQALSLGRMGESISLPSLDLFMGETSQPLEFQRFELFAFGARIMVLGENGAIEWQRDARQFFIASNGTTGVGLAVDTESGQISGFAIKGDSKLELDGQLNVGIELTAVAEPPDANNSCETLQDEQPPQSLQFLSDGIPDSLSAVEGGQAINYQAVVAVDTDIEWMAGKSNNPATALTWITDAFLAMNVFYERDVETRLLIGDVTFRTGSDPYSVATGRSAQLDEFALHWRNNMASVDRDFAALLSGRDVCSGCFSGIAWLNQYCQKGFSNGGRTVGSYSFNAIGTNRSASGIAIYLGHEIGHNMGSPHTHCYSPAVDQCYNGEDDCYSGSVSCPAGGKGTIMSYCHVSGANAAGCGTSKSEFHPTVQSLIQGRLAANSPSCIAPFVTIPPAEIPIFKSSFEVP